MTFLAIRGDADSAGADSAGANFSDAESLGDVVGPTPFIARRPGAAAQNGAPQHSAPQHSAARGSGAWGSGVPGSGSPGSAARGADEPSPPRRLLGELAERFGILAPLLSDPRVTDVFVNGSAGAWVDRGDGPTRVANVSPSEAELRALAVSLVSLGGRHIDEATPCVDTRLGEGIRVHAVLPPVSTSGTLLSVRLPSAQPASLGWLESTGFFASIPREVVDEIVALRRNVLITGAGGSGKTTLLSAMLSSATSTHRIIAIEDVAELRVEHPHFLALEARQANLEGAGAIGLDRLVREALRMRPDRLVLGECRGAEIRDLLAALNTGHDGGAGTLHANSLADVPARLEALGALAGMSPEAVARQSVSAIEVVLHLARVDGARRLVQMGRFVVDDRGRLATVDLAASTSRPASASGGRSRGAHAAGVAADVTLGIASGGAAEP